MKKFPKFLITPVIGVVFLDVLFTLIGQPQQYWQDFSKLREGSPLGVAILSQNPWFFVAFMLIYAYFICLILRKLPLFLSIFAAISFYLGHVYGSATWVYTVFRKLTNVVNPQKFISWYVVVGYLVSVSFITSLFIIKVLKNKDN